MLYLLLVYLEEEEEVIQDLLSHYIDQYIFEGLILPLYKMRKGKKEKESQGSNCFVFVYVSVIA